MWDGVDERRNQVKEGRGGEMKLSRLIPKPRSAYLLVKCESCGNEQVIYSHTTSDIRCNVCGNLLAERTGGKAKIHGKVIRRVD